jgi:hypothetical protein
MAYTDLPKRYRVVDDITEYGNTPVLVTYYVVRKTKAGAWVVPEWAVSQGMAKPLTERTVKELRDDWGARFVLDGNGKRFAHESEDWARHSYGIRKSTQIKHARFAIECAEQGLEWLRDGKPAGERMFDMLGTPFVESLFAQGIH